MTNTARHGKRNILIAVTVILVIAITYTCSWFQLKSIAEGYYADAMKNYQAKKIMEALKGEKILNDKGYSYHGGFEQAVDAFKSAFALPKPQIYYQAKSRINEIIYKDITPETGLAIYRKFFRLDNEYLGEILIRAADLYYSQKKLSEALKTYDLAEESFPFNKEIADAAQKGINNCQKELKLK